MRKIINLYLLVGGLTSFQISVSGQTTSKWGVSAAINSVEAQLGDPEWDSWGYAKGNFHNFGEITNKSLSLSLIPKYIINDAVLLRFEVGVTNIEMRNYYDSYYQSSNPPSSHQITDQTIEQKIYRFRPGVQWNFMRKKFIETYAGVAASYLQYSEMKYHVRAELRTLPGNALYQGYDENTTAEGGFATGLGALGGFNIYLGKHISLGAEASFSMLYYKLGGEFSVNSIPLPNTQGTSQHVVFKSSYKGFEFSKIMPSMNVSAWF